MRTFTFAIFDTERCHSEIKVFIRGDTGTAIVRLAVQERSVSSKEVPLDPEDLSNVYAVVDDLLRENPAIRRTGRYYDNRGSFWDATENVTSDQMQEAYERATAPGLVQWARPE